MGDIQGPASLLNGAGSSLETDSATISESSIHHVASGAPRSRNIAVAQPLFSLLLFVSYVTIVKLLCE